MRSHGLYWPALFIAATGAVTVAFSVVVAPVGSLAVLPMTYVASVTTAALFLRMLFDPSCRRGIDAANKEIRGDHPYRFRWMMFDAEWGLFGSREGPRSLQLVRLISFIEFIASMIFSGKLGTGVLLLSAASFAVTLMLTIIHVGLNTSALSGPLER